MRTLLHRAEEAITLEPDKVKEREHIHKVLSCNGYKPWMLTLPKNKTQQREVPSGEKCVSGFSICERHIREIGQGVQATRSYTFPQPPEHT